MVRNYDRGKLYIRKRSAPEWLTYYLFIFPFLFSFLLDFLRLPSVLKYTVDVVWITVLLMLFVQKNVVLKKEVAPFAILTGVLFVFVLTAYVFNFQSPFYFMWGVRNNFRIYVAFFAYVTFFNEEDANFCFKFLDILFWINIPITFFQFFVLGYNQDFLGGIFGVEKGCNGYSLAFLALVLCKSVLSYMNGQEKTLPCFLKCAASIIIAAMAELKIFFVFFVIILVFATVLTKSSWKKFFLFFIMAMLLMVGSSILTAVFGEKETMSLARIIDVITSSNYSSTEDLGRFTAIPVISESILTDLPGRLFGMGLGNCDTAAFAICNTPFFQAHEYLHYVWFSSAFLFLETGYVGLILTLSFFVISFIFAYKSLRKGRCNRLYCQMALIVSVICVLLIFQNASLRTEVGYFVYFALALPLISGQPQGEQRESLTD